MQQFDFQVLIQGWVDADSEEHAQKIIQNAVSINFSVEGTKAKIALKKSEGLKGVGNARTSDGRESEIRDGGSGPEAESGSKGQG